MLRTYVHIYNTVFGYEHGMYCMCMSFVDCMGRWNFRATALTVATGAGDSGGRNATSETRGTQG